LACCGRSTAPFLWIGGAEPSGCAIIGDTPGFRQYPFRVRRPNRSFRGRHPSRRITRLSRRAARCVAGTPRCSASSSCVVIRSSPRIIVPWTADKACCQSVGALLIDALSVATRAENLLCTPAILPAENAGSKSGTPWPQSKDRIPAKVRNPCFVSERVRCYRRPGSPA
jgi:hypothetical protein